MVEKVAKSVFKKQPIQEPLMKITSDPGVIRTQLKAFVESVKSEYQWNQSNDLQSRLQRIDQKEWTVMTDYEPEETPQQKSAMNLPRPDLLTVDSRILFRGRREIQIRHEGEVYRLLVTRNGRLILNK